MEDQADTNPKKATIQPNTYTLYVLYFKVEDPGSRPSSVGGGVTVAENEDDDGEAVNHRLQVSSSTICL
jgi:hypothetical protein